MVPKDRSNRRAFLARHSTLVGLLAWDVACTVALAVLVLSPAAAGASAWCRVSVVAGMFVFSTVFTLAVATGDDFDTPPSQATEHE